MEDVNESSRTELDSHANMPVIGRNAYILSKIGETVDVAPLTPDYKPISVELVDAALKYECPYPLIVQPLSPYLVLVRHIFTTLQYTFKTLQELFQCNKYVLLLCY